MKEQNKKLLFESKVGGIVTLRDYQTQTEFKKNSVDFTISGVRKYQDTEGLFKLTGYLLSGPNKDTPFMVMVKEVGSSYNIFIYYLDINGDIYEAGPGVSECPYIGMFTSDFKDLTDRIEVTIHYNDGDINVVWDKMGKSSLTRYEESTGFTCAPTISDYITDSENKGNNRCFIDWRGIGKVGNIEMWYGCGILEDDIDITTGA